MEKHSCSSWHVVVNSIHRLVQSLDHLFLCSVAQWGSVLGQKPTQEFMSCSCLLAFLQSVLFDALYKDRQEKPGSFVKDSLLIYILERKKISLNSENCRNWQLSFSFC